MNLLLINFLIRIEVVRLVAHLGLRKSLLFRIHEWRLLLRDHLLLDEDLIVFISMLILDFILVICDEPLTVNDVLELIESWRQLLHEEEGPIRPLRHGDSR